MALLALVAAIRPGEETALSNAVSNIVGAVFVVLTNSALVAQYIKSRTSLKKLAVVFCLLLAAQPSQAGVIVGLVVGGRPACDRRGSGRNNQADPAVLAALARIEAQQAAMMALLQAQMMAPKVAPSAPSSPIIMLQPSPPMLQPPIDGAPRLAPPVDGPPKLAPPISGPPILAPPIASPPILAPPVGGAPRMMPPATAEPPSGFNRLTTKALWR